MAEMKIRPFYGYIKQTVKEKKTKEEKENVIKGWSLIGYTNEEIAEALDSDVAYVKKCLERYFKRTHCTPMTYDEYRKMYRG